MESGWTGGQFSLVRAALGLFYLASAASLAVAGDPDLDRLTAAGVSAGFGSALLAGAFVRTVAGFLLALWVVTVWTSRGFLAALAPELAAFHPASHVLTPALLVVLVLLPRAPYGSWPARGRRDPAGGWRFPPAARAVLWGFWIALVGYHTTDTLAHWHAARAEQGARVLIATELALLFVLGAWSARWRPAAWLALVACTAGGALRWSLAPGEWPVAAALLALAFDPAWIAPRPSRSPPIVLFDGGCALCHAWVRFVLAEDLQGAALRLAPLGGTTAARELEGLGALPDSVVVLERGAALTRSRAVARVLESLGGLWRPLAWGLYLVPRPFADAVYDFMAARRKHWFAAPSSICPELPPELARRIEP